MFKKVLAIILTLCFAGMTAGGCGNNESGKTDETTAQAETKAAEIKTNLPKLDMKKWQYDEDDKIYYQLGLDYCEKPADKTYEQLAVFVPAAYMDGTKNSDGSYTCKFNESAKVSGYTAANAPIVMPIVTPGYAPAPAMTEYGEMYFDNITDYTEKGFVYVFSGCRGINEGAPSGVTDIKAAIRYIRYCDDEIAGSAESIFVYGMSGGGAQAAILGASGDSELYEPYLEKIGAVQGVSDAVAGSMDWCPITDLDTANAEYEWMMGCTRSGRSSEEQAISDGLANAFADYINGAGFTDKDGNKLTLEKSNDGIYQAGSYYDYIKSVIEKSLNNYLSDTDFSEKDAHNTYGSAQKYIDELNKDKKWISYDKSSNTATITSIADFAKACKQATELIVAFDQPDSQNSLFGTGNSEKSHFDKILADVLKKQNNKSAADYEADFKKTDFAGNNVEKRVNMYTPLYYLMQGREGFGKSAVAKYWRIRTGIAQNNTSVTTEVNLALALEKYDGVKSVDFETVWAQGHTHAERKGDSAENFIEWVNNCMK